MYYKKKSTNFYLNLNSIAREKLVVRIRMNPIFIDAFLLKLFVLSSLGIKINEN